MSAPVDPERVVELVEAAARSALADTLSQTGAMLAQAIAPTILLQLQRAEEAHARLANLHDELAAVIAHDMRTPIAAILLQVEGLLERAKRDDHVTVPTAALARMHHAGQRISRLAGDLLDVSRIELARVALDREQLSLRDAIADLVAQLEPAFPQRAITVVEHGDVPAVSADRTRFDQIVTNLLENAAKYSRPGRPITVHLAGDDSGATVSIEDEGPEIPAAEIPKLFDRFFQTRAARARKAGLGLGLYIAKGLVEAHGGRIWVDSVERGNQFHVWLPCALEGRQL
jgi:signal transduction histidine kinase